MISFQSMGFNWLPRTSAWQEAQNWHARQQQHQADFEAASTLASSTFESAAISFTSGMAELAVKAANKRTQALMQAKVKAVLDKTA
jgi:hypothetical protein